MALVTNPTTCLIDASTAHRTASDWVFGLPELAPDQRERIRASKRIANPGCHSTGFILLLRPLVDAGLVSPTALLSATSITGYSGGGKKMIEQYEAGGDPRLDSPRPYGLDARPQAPAGDDGAQPARDARRSSCRSSATSTRACRSRCRCTCRS